MDIVNKLTKDCLSSNNKNYEHEKAYFFDSNVYKRANFIRYNFDMVYRQNDAPLLNNLCKLRNNQLEALDFFNSCRIQDEERRKNAVIITPFRAVAERINADRLNQIQAPEIVYSGELSGTFSEKDVPAPLQLTLKIGALVVFVKNGDKWHNGSMGIVRNLSAKEIQVQLLSGNKEIVNVKPEKWQKIEYIRDENDRLMENEVGAYKQFPLNLGYAMTIHKAQGKTLDAVEVDISRGAFEHGQTYVALSRTRNSADMHLASPLRNKDVIFDNRVLDFVNNG